MAEATPAKLAPEPEHKTVSFGTRLKRERESRGIALDDVSIATKISLRMLRALEDEKFDQLPGGIFNKGFVRAYARHLGMNEEQAVADYLEAAGETAVPQNVQPPENIPVPPKPPKEPHTAEIPWGLLAILLLAAAVILSLWSYRTRASSTGAASPEVAPPPAQSVSAQPAVTAQPAPSPDSAAVQPAPTQTARETPPQPAASSQAAPTLTTPAPVARPQAVAPGSTPLNTVPTAPNSNVPAAVPQPHTPSNQSAPNPNLQSSPAETPETGGTVKQSSLVSPDARTANAANSPKLPAAAPPPPAFVLLIEAEDNSWVSITADGKTVLDGTLIAPAVKSIKAQNQIIVKAGNVGVLSFTLNGKKLPPQGDAGQVKTLTFSAPGPATPAVTPNN